MLFDITHPSAWAPGVIEHVQNQLMLLIHANHCNKKDETNELNVLCGLPPRYPICNLPDCQKFKIVLNHMKGCQLGSVCKEQYCWSSKQIVTHWKACKNEKCALCSHLRSLQTKQTK
uniref:histone acetyltransferase n=1 Tax=Caenorhabditis tropicalis TaxID=1561998 RepID=A0A1I7TLE2_9PELO